jgi:hypothetical protein
MTDKETIELLRAELAAVKAAWFALWVAAGCPDWTPE